MSTLVQTLLSVVGNKNFLDKEAANARYTKNTISYERELMGAVILTDSNQIPAILKIANENNLSIYPISTGKNWGYGSSLPVNNYALLVDLSQLNRIIEFNAQLGFIVVEPGVTQQDLYDFIQKNSLDYMVPTTGAGPEVSILGNAIEKGYGITPVEDHSLSLLSLKAYLPDGALYESQLTEFGGHRSDQVFKWKIGPQLDSLFSQSNLGIVFQATIAMARKPEITSQFISFIDEDNLEDAIRIIREIKVQLGSTVGGINIMNKRRILSMVSDPSSWSLTHAANENLIRELATKQNFPDWMVLGGLYGPKSMVAAAEAIVSSEFNKITNKTIFLNRSKINIIKNIMKILPVPHLKKAIAGLDSAINVLEGVPSQVALPLTYLKNRIKPAPDTKVFSPDQDNCGLIWFSPLLPIDGKLVRDFTAEVHRVCLYHDIEPLITLTAISERCFDSTIPILFNKEDVESVKKAQACHQDLMKMTQDLGIFPYRLDVRSMPMLYDAHHGVASKLWNDIKEKIDPKGVVAPGRYQKVS
ncbi:MAG: FAD-binding protein [Bdellovibrionales bacterium]|nr:FAD-binding protein [Bdellovibrionales bacterium]